MTETELKVIAALAMPSIPGFRAAASTVVKQPTLLQSRNARPARILQLHSPKHVQCPAQRMLTASFERETLVAARGESMTAGAVQATVLCTDAARCRYLCP